MQFMFDIILNVLSILIRSCDPINFETYDSDIENSYVHVQNNDSHIIYISDNIR